MSEEGGKAMKCVLRNLKFVVLATLATWAGSALATVHELNKNGEWFIRSTDKAAPALSRGQECTFWIKDFAPGAMIFDFQVIGHSPSGLNDVTPTEVAYKYDADGNVKGIYLLLTEEDWAYCDEGVRELKFDVVVYGFYDEENPANNKFDLGKSLGRADFPSDDPDPGPTPTPVVTDPKGSTQRMAETFTPAEPTTLADLTKVGSFTRNMTFKYESAYYFKTAVKLTPGRKYYFGLSTEAELGMKLYASGQQDLSVNLLDGAKDFTDMWTACRRAYEFVPEVEDYYFIKFSGGNSDTKFTFYHAAKPDRKIDQHPSTPVAPGDAPVTFTPGYQCDPATGAEDQIIDQQLFALSGLKKGGAYVFSTAGANRPLLLKLYDKNGKVIAENNWAAEGGNDVCLGWVAPSADKYYLGICQKLEDGEIPSAGPTTLTVVAVDLEDEPTALRLGETPNTTLSPFEAGGAVPSEPRTLGATSWTNTFTFAARKGFTYHFATRLAVGGLDNGLTVSANAYIVTQKGRTSVKNTSRASAFSEFKPDRNGTLEIEVSVAADSARWGTTGQGLAYGPYEAAAVAVGNFGTAVVDLQGAPEGAMKWIFTKRGTSSLSGEEYATAADGREGVKMEADTYTVSAAAVKGFTTPTIGSFMIQEGVETKVTGLYVDEIEKGAGDNDFDHAKELKPTAKGVDVSRSLHTNDVADCYFVKTAANAYYRFTLTEKQGNACVQVFGADKKTELPYVLAGDSNRCVQVFADKKDTIYVKVSHAEGLPENGGYTLSAVVATPGTVKFKSTAVSAKDSAAYVDLSVTRDGGKDGLVRVTYRTEGCQTDADDAYYFPTNGVLAWADGDNKAKTVRVRLVPNHGWVSNKVVKVVLAPVPAEAEDFDAEHEYVATIAEDKYGAKLDTATVTIGAAAKKVPGTIQAANAPDGSVKKPVYVVKAGEAVTVKLERAVNVNGTVGVTVATAKGTANKSGETDFYPVTTNLVWGDGETRTDEIVLRTKPTAGDFTGVKNFTLKLTAIKAKTVVDGREITDAPTLASSSITINITNDKFDQTVADWAKTLPKAEGVSAKGSNWFRGNDASLYASIARKIAGPARVRWGADEESLVNVAYVAKSENVTMPCTDVFVVDPLTAAVPAAPTLDKAIVAEGPVEFAFNRDELDAQGISYRVYALSDGASRTNVTYDARGNEKKSVVKIKLGDPETEIQPEDGKYATNVVYEAKGNKGKYTWRVDTFFEGGTVTNTAKSAWTLNAVVAGTPATHFEKDQDPSDCSVGVACCWAFADDQPGYAIKAVKLLSGKLGDFKVEQDKVSKTNPDGDNRWYLRGTQKKAGDFEALVQATYTNVVGKAVEMKGTTCAVRFTVSEIPLVTALAPTADKATIKPGEKVALCFARPDDWEEQGLGYRVFFDIAKNKSSLGKYDKTSQTCIGQIDPPYEVTVEEGVAYAWQVYSFYEGGTVTNKSAAFALNGAASCDGAFKTTAVTGEDSDGNAFDGKTTMRLYQRKEVSFAVAAEEDPQPTKVAVAGGKLPDGVEVEQDKADKKWYVRGTPTKAGSFEALVQATYKNAAKKDVLAATTAMKFEVVEVDKVPDITFTLTGPGRFTYTGVDYLGRETNAVVDIAAGSKSLVLKDIPQLDSYLYEPIVAAVATGATVNKAVVLPGEVTFAFNRAELDAKGISYRVFALSDGASRTNVTVDAKGNEKKTVVKIKLGDPETEIRLEGGKYATNVVCEAKGNKGKYTWRVDTFFEGGTVTNVAKSAWTLTVATAPATAGGVPAVIPTTQVVGEGVRGAPIDAAGAAEIVLHQLVKASFAIGAPGSSVKKVDGKEPDGLKLEQDKATKQWYLRGTPKKAGDFAVLYQETDAKSVAGATTALAITVEPVGTAQGTFNGLVQTFDTEDGFRSLASVTFTAASDGKLSAKVKIGGKDYSFTDTGYAAMNGDLAESNVTLVAELVNEQKNVKINGKSVTYTNTLSCTVFDLDETDPKSWLKDAEVSVHMAKLVAATGSAYDDDIWYEGVVCRDNAKLNTGKANDPFVEELAKFAGYYTVALVNTATAYGVPKGNGYVTLTLDAKGKPKFAGMLPIAEKADGTKALAYSAASAAVCLYGYGDDTVLRAPFFAAKSPYAFGGWIEFRRDGSAEAVPVVFGNSACGDLVLKNDDANCTRGAWSGYSLYLHPVGGWYDTVLNLQRAYIDRDFSVDLPNGYDDLAELAETLPTGYSFVAAANPQGQAVTLAGNALSVDKQTPAPKAGKENDWAAIANPANVTVKKFTRATGVVEGTFDLWYAGVNAKGVAEDQNALYKGLGFSNILLLSRDNDGWLEDDVWTTGYFLAPQTLKDGTKSRKWTGSYRFDIKATKVPRVWKDAE